MKRKAIFVALVLLLVIIAGGEFWRAKKRALEIQKNNIQATNQAANVSQSDNASCSASSKPVTYQACVDNIKNTKVENSESIYQQFGNLTVGDDPSTGDLARAANLMQLYYSCNLLSSKDEKIMAAADKYADSLKGGLSAQYVAALKNQFEDITNGKINTPYLTLGENQAFGDLTSICPDELTTICKESGAQKNEGVAADAWAGYCEGLCSKIQNNLKNPDVAQKNIFDKTMWQVWQGKSDYRGPVSGAYRIGGKDLAAKLCQQSDLSSDQVNDCLQRVAILDMKNVSCGDVLPKLAELVCQKMPQ